MPLYLVVSVDTVFALGANTAQCKLSHSPDTEPVSHLGANTPY